MKNNKEYQEKFDNEKEINTEQEDFDEEYDEEQEDSEDYDDSDEEEDEYAELAPSSILGYIRFMRDKENKKYTFSDMPKIFKSKILKHLLLAVLAIGLGLAMLVVYKTFIALIIAGIVTVLLGILALRLYLIGSRKQYVQFKGVVVRSDYTKNVIEKAKNSLSKTVKADFRYNSFVVKTEDEYVRVNCNNPKELPQEGDAVKVTIPGNSKVYEEEGLTTITTYIDIERIA